MLLKLWMAFKFRRHYRALYFNMQHQYFREIYSHLYISDMKDVFLHWYLLSGDKKQEFVKHKAENWNKEWTHKMMSWTLLKVLEQYLFQLFRFFTLFRKQAVENVQRTTLSEKKETLCLFTQCCFSLEKHNYLPNVGQFLCLNPD